MIEIAGEIIQAVRDHAAQEAPRECCGVVIVVKGRQRYWPCRNISFEEGAHFTIDPTDYAEAADAGEIVAIAHSHVFISPEPNAGDRVFIEKTNLPWLIVNHPVGHYTITEPNGYKAPLIGRTFIHGIFDCYALAQDYYREEQGIALPDFHRDESWWAKGQNILIENFESFGFVQIDQKDLREGDAILMQLGCDIPNHIGVYVGNNHILHHATGRLSSRDVYGEMWRRITTHYLRHGSKA